MWSSSRTVRPARWLARGRWRCCRRSPACSGFTPVYGDPQTITSQRVDAGFRLACATRIEQIIYQDLTLRFTRADRVGAPLTLVATVRRPARASPTTPSRRRMPHRR